MYPFQLIKCQEKLLFILYNSCTLLYILHVNIIYFLNSALDQEMASLNLESTTAQAAMNPLNTSLISSTIAGAPYVPGASIVTGAPYTPGASTIGGTPYNPATFNPAGPQTTAAPVPLFQTPTLVPTPVSSGQLPAHNPSTAGPAVPPMYSSPLIPAFSTATGVAPAPYTGSFASAAATAKPSPANISAAFSTPSQPPVSSFPGSTVTVTAKPFQLTTDITAGATPAPLTPVSSVSNGEDASALQQTVSPQILAQ